MTLSGADKVISEFLAANWTQTPVSWPNIEGRNYAVAGYPLLPEGTSDYVAVRTTGAGSRTITVPGRCIRTSAQIFFAACVKEGLGQRKALEYIDDLIALFENARLTSPEGTVRMSNYTGPAGYPAPNGWFVQEIGVMFYFERFSQV